MIPTGVGASRRPRDRAIACVLAGLTLALGGGAARAGTSGGDQVRQLGDAYLARVVQRSPEQATALGLHDHDARLLPVTQATLDEDRAWYRDFAARLKAIPAAGLPAPRAIERDLLIGRAAAELAELETTRRFETDPGAYVALIGESVRAVLERNVGSVCGRAHVAGRRLAQVPEVLRAARINLRDAPPERIDLGLERLEGVLRFYREDVPRLAADCHDGRVQADLAEGDSAAVEALVTFITDLRAQRDEPATARRSLAIGEEACRRRIEADLMERVSLDSLRAEAGHAVDAGRRRVDSLAAIVKADPPVRLDHWRIEYAVRRIGTFVVQHELVTVRPAIGATVVEAPPYAIDPLALVVPGPWDEKPGPNRLEVVTTDSLEAPAGRHGTPMFTASESELLVMRETVPGDLGRAVALQSAPSRLVRMLAWSWPGDAWGGFAERLILDAGYDGGEPAMALAEARSALRRDGRTLAAIGLYSGSMTLDQATRMLADRCGLDTVTAAYEARMAVSDPGAMVYTHAVSSLVAMRDTARARLGPRFNARAFVDAALKYGGVPTGWVRAQVARDPGSGIVDTSGAAP